MKYSHVAPLSGCHTNADNYFVQVQSVLSLSCLHSAREVKLLQPELGNVLHGDLLMGSV